MSNALQLTAPEGQPTIELVREVDAPVEAVWAAHRDPDLLARWLGPHGYAMDVTEYDFRSGGRYRYVHRNPAGDEFGFHGCFHTVREHELAVQTFEFEGAPDHVSLDTMRFEALEGGRTRLRGHSVFQSVEARDAMLASGMERGMREGYERLDDVVGGTAVPTSPSPSPSPSSQEAPDRDLDWTLEVVVLPVTDIDRATRFYREQVGFHLDHDIHNEHLHLVQLTPRGSGCSLVIGDLPAQNQMAPGSMRGLQLVVADARAAREELVGRGVECDEISVVDPRDGGTFFGFADPDGNTWAVQEMRVRAEHPLIPVAHRDRTGS